MMRVCALSGRIASLAVALIVCGCGSDVTTYRTPNYAPHDVPLSVLGVFKNGRMEAAAWGDWAPAIAAATGDGTCAAAFDEGMEKAVPGLFSELDDIILKQKTAYEILDRAATSALGDAILVMEVFGRAPK